MMSSSSTTLCKKPYAAHARCMPCTPPMSAAHAPNASPPSSASAQRPASPGAAPTTSPTSARMRASSVALGSALRGMNMRAGATVGAS